MKLHIETTCGLLIGLSPLSVAGGEYDQVGQP